MKSFAVVFWLFIMLSNPLTSDAGNDSFADTTGEKERKLVQSALRQTQTAILSYTLKGGELHIDVLTNQSDRSLCLPTGSVFFNNLMKVKNALLAREPIDRAAAHALYTKLVGSVDRYLKGVNHLIIIPCEKTGLVPFEVLVPDTTSKRYLLHDYAVSYAYSLEALLNRRPALSDYERQKVLAIAPFNVASAEKEVLNIKADHVMGPAASKDRFIEKAGDYAIIHLATHVSLADPPNSFIGFHSGKTPRTGNADSRLSVSDIAKMSLENVNLIILSPCLETPQNHSLDGVYSMAKAFAQAGCPNLITSLWNPPKESAHRIVMKLHQYIHKGYGYAQALQQARIDYIQNPSVEDELKTPAYWAGFVLLGEINTASESHKIFYYFALAFTVLITVYILRKRKRKVSHADRPEHL